MVFIVQVIHFKLTTRFFSKFACLFPPTNIYVYLVASSDLRYSTIKPVKAYKLVTAFLMISSFPMFTKYNVHVHEQNRMMNKGISARFVSPTT